MDTAQLLATRRVQLLRRRHRHLLTATLTASTLAAVATQAVTAPQPPAHGA